MRRVTTKTPAGSTFTAALSNRKIAGELGIEITGTNEHDYSIIKAVLSRNAADALMVALGELLGPSGGDFTIEQEY